MDALTDWVSANLHIDVHNANDIASGMLGLLTAVLIIIFFFKLEPPDEES